MLVTVLRVQASAWLCRKQQPEGWWTL